MRKLRWIGLGALAFLVVCAITALQKPPDPLRDLKASILEDKTEYVDATHAQKMLGTPDAPSMSYRYVTIAGVDPTRLTEILSKSAPQKDGWSEPLHITGKGFFEFESYRRGPRSIRAVTGGFTKDQLDRSKITIEIGTPMNAWDVFVVRLTHLGHDPFRN